MKGTIDKTNIIMKPFTKAGMIVLLLCTFTLVSGSDSAAQSGDSEVHTVVDEMPEMIGGASVLYGEIKYPRSAVRAGIEGRVFIQFVVDKEGNVRDEKVLRDIGGGCGDAALEAVREVKFTPGRLKGEIVNVQYSMPVTFKLENG